MNTPFFKTIFLKNVLLFAVIAMFVPAISEARSEWPYSDSNCINKSKKFGRDCTIAEKFVVRDMTNKQVSTVYKNRRVGLNDKDVRKIYKLQNLGTPEKTNSAKDRSRWLTGLRDDQGKELLPTIYLEVHPLSPSHSIVKLFNDEYKIASHSSNVLSDISHDYDSLFTLTSEYKDLYYAQVFLLENTKPKTDRTATIKPLLPNLTYGSSIDNVQHNTKSTFISEYKTGYTVQIKKGERLKFDEWNNLIKETGIESLGVHYAKLKNNVPYSRSASKVMKVGRVPDPNIASNLNPKSTLTSDVKDLYWPIDENNKLLPRPEYILGMVPFSRNGYNRDVYPDSKPVDDAWLVVLRDGGSFDYIITAASDTSQASIIIKNLDKFLVLDDVYFRNAFSDSDKGYAIKPKSSAGTPQSWYGYLPDESPKADAFTFFSNDKVENGHAANTAAGAIQARITADKIDSERSARHQAERDAEYARRNKAKFQAEFGWRRPTTPAAQCAASYSALQAEYMRNTANPYFQSKKAWMEKYEANGSIPCDTPPGSTSSDSTYSLNDGLRDIGNAAACTRQEKKCVRDGQYERCRMVTVKIC